MNSQTRSEIHQIILKLPENRLKPILEYLKEVEKATKSQIEKATLIKKIFEEETELLKRLAQ